MMETTQLCQKCHQVKHVLIRCRRCGKMCCLACYYTSKGLCADCIVDKFNEYYKDKVEKYAKT